MLDPEKKCVDLSSRLQIGKQHHKMLNENFKGHENPGKRTTGI